MSEHLRNDLGIRAGNQVKVKEGIAMNMTDLATNPKNSVTMQWTYIAGNWKTAKQLPQDLIDAYLKRLADDYKVPAAHIDAIKDAIKNEGKGFGVLDFDEQILLDGFKTPIAR